MHVFHGYLLASGHMGGGFNHQKQRQLVNIYETNWMGYVLENPQFIDYVLPKHYSQPAQPSTVIQNEPEPEPASSNEPEPGCSNATSDSSSDAAPTLQFIFLLTVGWLFNDVTCESSLKILRRMRWWMTKPILHGTCHVLGMMQQAKLLGALWSLMEAKCIETRSRSHECYIYPLVNIQKTSKNYGKSPFLMRKSTRNGHVQ